MNQVYQLDVDEIDETCTSCQLVLDTTVAFRYNELWQKNCNNCTSNMVLQESKTLAHESEWACQCGHKEYSEQSLFDHQQSLIAIDEGREEEYASGDVRAPFLVRMKRRKICETCTNNKDDVCGGCGCRIKHRTYYADLACPLSHW